MAAFSQEMQPPQNPVRFTGYITGQNIRVDGGLTRAV